MGAQVYKLVEVGQDAGREPGGFQMFADLPDVLNVRQAARAIGASECWTREAIARGEKPAPATVAAESQKKWYQFWK